MIININQTNQHALHQILRIFFCFLRRTVDGQHLTNSYKTMMYIDHCDVSTGCTVVLRDAPDYSKYGSDADHVTRSRLHKVKDVLLKLIRFIYHGRLEVVISSVIQLLLITKESILVIVHSLLHFIIDL